MMVYLNLKHFPYFAAAKSKSTIFLANQMQNYNLDFFLRPKKPITGTQFITAMDHSYRAIMIQEIKFCASFSRGFGIFTR